MDLRVKALYSFPAFLELIKFKGGLKSFGKIHRKMMTFISKHQAVDEKLNYVDEDNTYTDRLQIVARGHLKTTINVGYLLWRIYRNPDIRILLGCDDLTLAKDIVRMVMQYLADGELQRRVWHNRPHIKGLLVPVVDGSSKHKYGKDMFAQQIAQKTVWGQLGFQVIRPGFFKELTLTPTSVNTTGTGSHCDLVVLDDVVNFDNSRKPEHAQRIIDWQTDLYAILDPIREVIVSDGSNGTVPFKERVGGELHATGTFYYPHDLYAHMLANRRSTNMKVFVKNIYQNGQDNTEGYTWPEVWNTLHEQRIRARVKNAQKFASQYLCSHIASANVQLDPSLINIVSRANVRMDEDGFVRIMARSGEISSRCMIIIEPASSLDPSADNTAIGVMTTDFYGNVYLVDGKKGRYRPREAYQIATDFGKRYNASKVIIESGVNLQGAYLDNFQQYMTMPDMHRMNCIPYVPRGNKKDNILITLANVMDAGKLFMVDDCFRLAEMELIYFPSESAKDDFIDMIHIGVKHTRYTGLVTHTTSSDDTRHIRYNTRHGGIVT